MTAHLTWTMPWEMALTIHLILFAIIKPGRQRLRVLTELRNVSSSDVVETIRLRFLPGKSNPSFDLDETDVCWDTGDPFWPPFFGDWKDTDIKLKSETIYCDDSAFGGCPSLFLHCDVLAINVKLESQNSQILIQFIWKKSIWVWISNCIYFFNIYFRMVLTGYLLCLWPLNYWCCVRNEYWKTRSWLCGRWIKTHWTNEDKKYFVSFKDPFYFIHVFCQWSWKFQKWLHWWKDS